MSQVHKGLLSLTVAALLGACGGADEQDKFASAGSSATDGSTAATSVSSTASSTASTTTGASASDSDSSGTTSDGTGGGIKLDVSSGADLGTGECNPDLLPPAEATLTGVVYAPNGEIPISGALVYTWVDSDVPGAPEEGVYCDECVELPCGEFTFTNPDGTFELSSAAGMGRSLVVQKGQFMRVSDIDVAANPNPVPVDVAATTLPDKWDPAIGEYIPKIALIIGPYDTVHDVIAKLGLGDVTAQGGLADGAALRSFDIYGSGNQWENQYGGVIAEGLDLLHDPAMMDNYHIIFIPCGSEGDMAPPSPLNLGELEDSVIANLQDWVGAGGKLYVTDDAQEYVSVPFAQYQTFYEVNDNPDLQEYDSLGTVLDSDLEAWLGALPDALKDIGQGQPTLFQLPQVMVLSAWSAVEAVHEVLVPDANMNPVNVGHKVWIEGEVGGSVPAGQGPRPLSISGQYGCGRILFSTYHTSTDPHTGLSPQELILMYLIAEIGVCAENPLPPPQG